MQKMDEITANFLQIVDNVIEMDGYVCEAYIDELQQAFDLVLLNIIENDHYVSLLLAGMGIALCDCNFDDILSYAKRIKEIIYKDNAKIKVEA